MAQSAAQPVIFHSSLSAQPGDAISLQGAFSASAKVWLMSGAAGDPILLPVQTQSAGQATVQVPSSLAYGFYQVWVDDNDATSPVVNVNMAWGQFFDTSKVAPSSKLRLFGRNLNVAGGTPQAWLVNHDTNSISNLTVDVAASSPYVLSLSAPDHLQKDATYDVYVSNGLAGPYDATKVDKQLTGIAAGKDYFGLGVSWAADLNFYDNVWDIQAGRNMKTGAPMPVEAKATGDGVTNDYPAIEYAIRWLSLYGGGGGSVLYFPAGKYKLGLADDKVSPPQIDMASHVVLKGEGDDKTILTYGYYASNRNIIDWDPTRKVGQSGLADLSLVNVDTTGNVKSNVSGSNQSEIFVQNCIFNTGKASGFNLSNIDGLVVANSKFTQSANGAGFSNTKHFRIANNDFHFDSGGIGLDFAQEGVFEGNTETRDAKVVYTGVVHQLGASFAENIAIINNSFLGINGPFSDSQNDGETILAEGGGPNRLDEDGGVLTAATATTLQDTGKNWSGFKGHPVVAIVNGPGMGQVRGIEKLSGSTLTLTTGTQWDVSPTAGSHYAIFNWASRNWLVQGNVLNGNRIGIQLVDGGTNQVAIVGNQVINSGSIRLFPNEQKIPLGNGNLGLTEFLPAYDNQMIGNTVKDLDGQYKAEKDPIGNKVPLHNAFIGVEVGVSDQELFGTLVIGLEVRGNSVTAYIPNLPGYGDAANEGYANFLIAGNLAPSVDNPIPAILGTIFQNNTAINTDNAITINGGAYNTFICNTILSNSLNPVLDGGFNGTAGFLTSKSVGTKQCAQPQAATNGV